MEHHELSTNKILVVVIQYFMYMETGHLSEI